jgi:VIT1/CCC1 family predicted Fe2+/Mn2+ transporter
MTKEHDHTPEAIRERLTAGPRNSYLRDFVYGGIDGAVTTFAVVSGVVGAELAPAVILILGAANLAGDGFSMAASNYSGTRTEHEEMGALREREERHIAADPDGEREEVRQIFEAKGFIGSSLHSAVATVTADRERWIRFMLREEYGLPSQLRSPLIAALCTFGAFIVCGLVPLLPFVFSMGAPFMTSLLSTLAVFFAIGSVKSLWTTVPWWRAGLETLFIGGVAAALAYGAGALLKHVV